METVGEFDDEDANIGAEGNHEAEEIVFRLGEVSVDVVHVFSDFGEFCDAINEESDGFAEFGFYFFEGNRGVFDDVMEDAGDDGVFVHLPFFEDFFDSKRVDYVGLAGSAKLAGMGCFCEGDGFLDAGRGAGLFRGGFGFWRYGFGFERV